MSPSTRTPARTRAITWSVATLATLGLVGLFSLGGPAPSQAAGKDGERIGLLYADGVIMGNRPDLNPFGGGNTVSSIEMVQKLDQARKDDDIKAVVIRVNSPGGSAAASQEIYDAINKCKAEKPVYISMGDICASGGYFISAAATRIWATPSTLTGSIGVIMELPRYDGLLDKIGVEFRTFKAGEHKDIGSPIREMTEEERVILQTLLTRTHDQFIRAVANGRVASGQAELDEAGVRVLADGTIWTGEDAKGVGLVDELGGLQDVLDFAAKTANLDPEDYVVDEMETSFFDELFKGSPFETRAKLGPLAGLGRLVGALTMAQTLSAAQPLAAAQSTIPIAPQAGLMGLSNRLFLCDTLAGGGGISF